MTKETITAQCRRAGLSTGRTAQQMGNAEQGALYVWPNHNLYYPKELARHLGRTDLRIVSAHYAFQGGFLRGLAGEVVFDHAFVPNAEQRHILIDLTRRKAATCQPPTQS